MVNYLASHGKKTCHKWQILVAVIIGKIYSTK